MSTLLSTPSPSSDRSPWQLISGEPPSAARMERFGLKCAQDPWKRRRSDVTLVPGLGPEHDYESEDNCRAHAETHQADHKGSCQAERGSKRSVSSRDPLDPKGQCRHIRTSCRGRGLPSLSPHSGAISSHQPATCASLVAGYRSWRPNQTPLRDGRGATPASPNGRRHVSTRESESC